MTVRSILDICVFVLAGTAGVCNANDLTAVQTGRPVSRRKRSIACVWNEQNLAAIRVDTPHSPAQARNLFHLSGGDL
jgi:hypothetical protein